ncbi:MAG: hypothetical protein HY908_11055 [Myxococcales bacterium]|nr:hypothetical protein [Myxococcales bacterium]
MGTLARGFETWGPRAVHRTRGRRSDADLAALARAYDVHYAVRVPDGAAPRPAGYELELYATARAPMRACYGDDAAAALLSDALYRIAEGATAGEPGAVVGSPESDSGAPERHAAVTARMRIGLCHHDHGRVRRTSAADPCVTALEARLEDLGVPVRAA